MKKSTYKYLLALYIILMVFLSYMNQGVNNIGGLSYIEAVYNSSTLIPFYNISIKQCIISFVQFMPLGYLLPKVFSKLNQQKIFIIVSFIIITLYKATKLLLLTGYFNVTSIIFGFLGSYLIYNILIKGIPKTK